MLGKVGASIVHSRGKTAQTGGEKNFVCVYLVFFSAFTIAYQSHHNLGLCTFITLSVALQFLAYSLLAVRVVQQQSVRGVSGKALQCHALVYMSRLSSTTWLKGYIPTDSTGNGLYQACDAMSLLTVLCLLYFVHKRYESTYQREQDDFDISYLLGFCFCLAVVLHPHLNSRPLFDTLWTFALYVDVFAMMPQLWMVAKLESGVSADALYNPHYIMAIAASRGVNLYFWFHGFREFAPKDGSFNFTGWAIMGAHVIQCLLLADFAFFYVKACVLGSIKAVQTGDYSQPMMANVGVFQL
jgi:hypothetical protein